MDPSSTGALGNAPYESMQFRFDSARLIFCSLSDTIFCQFQRRSHFACISRSNLHTIFRYARTSFVIPLISRYINELWPAVRQKLVKCLKPSLMYCIIQLYSQYEHTYCIYGRQARPAAIVVVFFVAEIAVKIVRISLQMLYIFLTSVLSSLRKNGAQH